MASGSSAEPGKTIPHTGEQQVQRPGGREEGRVWEQKDAVWLECGGGDEGHRPRGGDRHPHLCALGHVRGMYALHVFTVQIFPVGMVAVSSF